jgi:hypothetical protein
LRVRQKNTLAGAVSPNFDSDCGEISGTSQPLRDVFMKEINTLGAKLPLPENDAHSGTRTGAAP